MALGWAMELVLLACVRDSIYVATRWTRWVAVAFVNLVLGDDRVVLWLAASRLRHRLARVVWSTLLAAGGALYGLSWGVYLRTSRFLDWDALRFSAVNFRLLWMYVRQAEHGAWYGAAAILMAAGAAVIGGGSWLAMGNGQLMTVIWQTCAAGNGNLVLPWVGGNAAALQSSMNPNIPVIARRQDALRDCLHPVVTLASSLVSSPAEDRIRPCIDPSELRPLAQAEAWNKMARRDNRAKRGSDHR